MRGWILISFLAVASSSIGARAEAIDGEWARGDGDARVRIEPCGKSLCAINTWIKDNSDGEDVGDRLIMNVAPKSTNELTGTAYDPKRNRTYSLTLDVGQTELTTRGCVLFGLLCRSVSWSRLPAGANQSD